MEANPRFFAFRTRGQNLLLRGLVLALLIASASPRRTNAAGERVGILDLVPEFNAICVELEQSRRALATGALDDEEFIDQILDLYVRVDSLGALLAERSPSPRADIATFALDRSIRFLKNSLRENYEGIVGRNGNRFVSADVAQRAAEAWRNAITLPEAVAP
jgi:hypothetical protein